MNFKKYNRFFAFGCSFTQYYWPTWYDIISQEIPISYNYGKSGAGNFFIFQALMEAIVKHNINKDDLVMIMFSNVTREDRFVKSRGWITPGNLYYQDEYDKKFLEKFFCEHGYLMRDLNLIHGCKLALDSIGCDYHLMLMVPLNSKTSNAVQMLNVDYLLKFYENTLNVVKPSVLEVVFKNDWNSRNPRPSYHVAWQKEKYVDNHPTPIEHLIYLESLFPEIIFSQKTLDFVNDNNKKIMSSDFKLSTYKTFLTPRLSQNYNDLSFNWNAKETQIRENDDE